MKEIERHSRRQAAHQSHSGRFAVDVDVLDHRWHFGGSWLDASRRSQKGFDKRQYYRTPHTRTRTHTHACQRGAGCMHVVRQRHMQNDIAEMNIDYGT